uniref:Uncharacterized protein n=1 Tax=Cucumis melo TaxID=3656 RepID=A0A9I9DIN1_CUCME
MEEECRVKTLEKNKVEEEEIEKTSLPPPPVKRKAKSTQTPLAKKLKVNTAIDKDPASNPSRKKKVIEKKVHLVGSISSSNALQDPPSPSKNENRSFLPHHEDIPLPSPTNDNFSTSPPKQTLSTLPPCNDPSPPPLKSPISSS